MTPEHVTIIALACLVAIAAVAVISTFKTKLVTARKEWLELSTLLTSYSLPHCAAILEDLAVDDLAGAFRECEYLLRLMRNPKQAAAALDQIFDNELPTALSDASRRPGAVKLIVDWISAKPSLAAAGGLATAPAASAAAASSDTTAPMVGRAH